MAVSSPGLPGGDETLFGLSLCSGADGLELGLHIACPPLGDGINIGADNFVIQGEPKRDRDRLIWTIELVPG